MSDETYWDSARKVKADIEKILEVNVAVTNSYWFRDSYLSKLCFIIICEERKQKVLILNSSEKFIMVLANIGHMRF